MHLGQEPCSARPNLRGWCVCLLCMNRQIQFFLRTNEIPFVSSADDVIGQTPSYKSALPNDPLLDSVIPGYMEQHHQNMMQEPHLHHYDQDQLEDQQNLSNSLGVSDLCTKNYIYIAHN